MLGRRSLLGRLVFGAVAASLGGRGAAALVVEAAPDAAFRRDNCSFVTEMQAALADEIARGAVPLGTQRVLDCPLCRHLVTVT